MLGILSATVPIFMVVGLGYATTRAGMFRRDDMSTFSKYVAKIALPLLVLFALWVGDWAIRAWRGKPMRHFGINALTMWSIFGFLAVFTVLRNTPWGSWLTPV